MTIDREIDALCSIARQYELVADPPYNFALRDLAVALRALQAENARLRAAVLAGIYDAADVGVTIIATDKLEAERAEVARLREDAERWPSTESLASQVLDEVEAAIAAGKAMGHGAYTIVHRLRRLLSPSQRADMQWRPDDHA